MAKKKSSKPSKLSKTQRDTRVHRKKLAETGELHSYKTYSTKELEARAIYLSTPSDRKKKHMKAAKHNQSISPYKGESNYNRKRTTKKKK